MNKVKITIKQEVRALSNKQTNRDTSLAGIKDPTNLALCTYFRTLRERVSPIYISLISLVGRTVNLVIIIWLFWRRSIKELPIGKCLKIIELARILRPAPQAQRCLNKQARELPAPLSTFLVKRLGWGQR